MGNNNGNLTNTEWLSYAFTLCYSHWNDIAWNDIALKCYTCSLRLQQIILRIEVKLIQCTYHQLYVKHNRIKITNAKSETSTLK